MGLLYALFGLTFGAFLALLSLLGTAIGVTNSQSSDAGARLPFGVGSVVLSPIFYSILHFVLGLITALLYNVVALAGRGIQLEPEETQRPSSTTHSRKPPGYPMVESPYGDDPRRSVSEGRTGPGDNDNVPPRE